MPDNEANIDWTTDPITTDDVIAQIKAKSFDAARDSVQNILYKKSGEAVAQKKIEVSKSIGKPDASADIVDFSEPSDDTHTPTTSEE